VADHVCCKRVEERDDHGGRGGKRDIEDCERRLHGHCGNCDKAHLRAWLEEAAHDEGGRGGLHMKKNSVQFVIVNTSIGGLREESALACPRERSALA
jgi:hypothetical protein